MGMSGLPSPALRYRLGSEVTTDMWGLGRGFKLSWDGHVRPARVHDKEIQNKNGHQGQEDGGEIGGSRVHFPSTPVKHLADLRNRVNSQWYSSIYEDQRPKIEDIERSDSKKRA